MVTINKLLDSLPKVQVDYIKVSKEDLRKAIKEFTEKHVTNALDAAAKNVSATHTTPVLGGKNIVKRINVDKNSILNAYPLNKIK